MAQDNFKDEKSLVGPASFFQAVVPDDDEELPFRTRCLYVGTGGDVAIENEADGVAVVHANVPSGSKLEVRTSKVLATGTTASDIVMWA